MAKVPSFRLLMVVLAITLLAACAAPIVPAASPTPTAAPVEQPTTAPVQVSASPRDPGVSGVACWGTQPVPDAIVELRTGGTRVNPDVVLQSAITDPEGRYLCINDWHV